MDLFGEVSITPDDVELWLNTIPQLSNAPFRRQAYAKAYRVTEKIAAAKRSGNWPPKQQHVFSEP